MANNELSIREVQLSCLKVMQSFDRLCRENQLTYFLSGGTLLGGIRHKGFIPWDDDVDLMMPRADYQRMLEIAPSRLEPGCEIFALGLVKGYSRQWARMTDSATRLKGDTRFSGDTQATYIDIFPIDGMPEGEAATKRFFRRLRVLDALCKSSKRNFTSKNERLKGLKALLRVLLKPIGPAYFARRMNAVAMKYPFASSKFRGVSMVTHYGAREKMPAGVFDHAVDVEFEGQAFPAPSGYDQYLKRLYGDYMQLPPEEKRISEHTSRYHKTDGDD